MPFVFRLFLIHSLFCNTKIGKKRTCPRPLSKSLKLRRNFFRRHSEPGSTSRLRLSERFGRDFSCRYSKPCPTSYSIRRGKSGRDFEPGNSRISSGGSGIRPEKVLAGLSGPHGRRMSGMPGYVTAESPGGTSPGTRVGRAGLRALRRAREILAGFFSRRKDGKPRNPLFLTERVPAGFLPGKKAGKSEMFAFFIKRVPAGLRPARTRACGGAYNGIYRAISLYAVAGSPRGTRSSFRCMRERNPGAIFSSHLSRAIPTGDPSERRMPGVNRVSDIES